MVQEIAGSDSDPNVARLTGSVELLPLAGATGEHGATGPDPLVGRMGCYPGNPAGAEAAVVRGGNVDRRNLGRLAGPMGLLDRRAVTVSYRFPAVAEPAGCQRTITPFYGESAQSTATSQVFDGVPRRVIPLRTTVARLRAIVASNRRGPGSSTSMRRLRGACDAGRKRRRSPRVSKKVIARRDYLI
jgi:hypothetical protein